MNSSKFNAEKERQEKYSWERSLFYENYSKILGYYQALSVIENAKKGSLLDLACGDGTITQHFLDSFEKIVGIDASLTHLTKAKNRVPSVDFHESLIESFESEYKFDTVTMLNLLEHVDDPVAILNKSASFLNDGGRLIVHVPNAEAMNRKIAVKMGTLSHLEELSPFDIDIAGHRRSYTMESFLETIENAQLKVINTGGVFYKMLSMAQMDWFLKNGLWDKGEFGWGRVGEKKSKNWKEAFCRACYEIGKDYPKECNVIYAVIIKG
jgi:2-polyprenyl-3-methyl-5-hydroxy-6-metoxy-1,4-benzoquinol methylase